MFPKSIAGLATLAGLAAAQGQNPVINPEISRTQIINGLDPHMPFNGASYALWDANWIYESCKSEAEMRGYNIHDIEVWDAYYPDCDSPWLMCRHKDVKISRDEIIIVSPPSPSIWSVLARPCPVRHQRQAAWSSLE